MEFKFLLFIYHHFYHAIFSKYSRVAKERTTQPAFVSLRMILSFLTFAPHVCALQRSLNGYNAPLHCAGCLRLKALFVLSLCQCQLYTNDRPSKSIHGHLSCAIPPLRGSLGSGEILFGYRTSHSAKTSLAVCVAHLAICSSSCLLFVIFNCCGGPSMTQRQIW